MSTVLDTGRFGSPAPASAKVLVVTGATRAADIVEALGRNGHEVHERQTLDEQDLDRTPFDVVFVESDQIEAARQIVGQRGTPIVAIDEHLRANEGVAAEAQGDDGQRAAGDAAMGLLVDLLIERSFLLQRCQELEQLAGAVRDGSAFLGNSPVVRRLHGALSRAASCDTTVLIEGAAGTGKSLAARVIHCKSKRGGQVLVVREAAELDGDALPRALDGAAGTTLVIEDVEQMPAPGQQALVRFLKERSRPTAGAAEAPRLVVTSSAHLPELVARGAFREDLYYRLHNYPIVMPALRERLDDMEQLAKAMLDQIGCGAAQRLAGFTPAAVTALESMSWPGNLTQLENVVRRAWLLAGGGPIDTAHLQGSNERAAPAEAGVAVVATELEEAEVLTEESIRPFEEEEQRLLSRALRATGGNVRRAAQLLGIGRATLYRKIQQYRLRLQ